MKDIDLPSRFNIAFASSQVAPYIRDVPDAPPGTPGAASLQLGFPGPDCFTPPTAGGTPPFGQDFNGLLKRVTAWARWQAAGGPAFYDAGFSAAIGGYMKGALLTSAVIPGLLWRSSVDDNPTDPDSVSAANWAQVGRICLTAPTTFYVNVSTGSDTTGTGMVSAPWKTLQRAFSVFQAQYDFQDHVVTVQLADGTYPDTAQLNGGIEGLTQPGHLIINGNSGTPSNVIYTAPISFQFAGSMGSVQNFKMSGTYGVTSSYGATAQIGSGMVWGPMSGYHIYGNTRGNVIISGNYTINGGAAAHISMLAGSCCSQGGGLTWTVTGNPAISSFVIADGLSLVSAAAAQGSSYSGTATGSNATVSASSLVYGTGANNSYFPGNGGVNVATQGQYL